MTLRFIDFKTSEPQPATIIDIDPTGSIAVRNRFHNQKTADLKLQS
jgi:hypothetical protein